MKKIYKNNRYLNIDQHLAQHQEFIDMYSELRKEILSKGADYYLALHIEKVLRSWWTDHILKSDMLYVPSIKLFE